MREHSREDAGGVMGHPIVFVGNTVAWISAFACNPISAFEKGLECSERKTFSTSWENVLTDSSGRWYSWTT